MSIFALFGETTWNKDEERKGFEYVVWKYELELDDVVEVEMPKTGRILKFDCQGGNARRPCLWVLVNKAELDTRVRRFRIAGTGHELKDGKDAIWHFIGTAQAEGGQILWHCFEILYPAPEGYKGLIYVPPDFPTIKVS